MAFSIISEALARVEHKLDLILKAIKYNELPDRMPMQFIGHQCPVCDKGVTYQVDLINNVVVRRCDCTSGKILPTTPLFPATNLLGGTNGNPNAEGPAGSEAEGGSPNRRRR